MPPAPSYPSPNAAQMSQGAMYYNRQLTADELLSAELSRETSGANLADGSANGVHHGQSMVLGSSNPGGPDMGRPPSADHQQQHMLQFTPSQQVGVDPNHDLSYGDQSARRKRSKISRACDECRRKKVRCDASSESGVETCSNCRRLGVVCQFSRVPMKRGPSKGYIKELAERLHTLESQMQPAMVHPDMQYPPMNEVSSPRGYHEFSPSMDPGMGRKRTYSVFEGLPNTSFAQPQFNPRASQHAYDTGDAPTDPENPTAINATAPKPGNLFWSPDNEGEIPQGALDVADMAKQAIEDDMTPLDVDDGALNAYYLNIHAFMPILPHSKERLVEILHQCTREIQEVFLYALYTVVRTNMGRVATTFEKIESFESAQEIAVFYGRQPAIGRPNAFNTILLQALLLMILDCDARGPENLTAKNGLSKQALIQSANKLACTQAKVFDQLRAKRPANPDVDGHANLTRRNWISLNILERWYAISVADPSVLGTFEIGGLEDEKISSTTLVQMGSYSSFLPEILTMALTEPNVCQSNTGMARMVAANLKASLERLADIERFRKPHEVPDDASAPFSLDYLEPQMYWTIRLLIKRHIYVYSPYEVFHAAVELVLEMHKQTTVGTRLVSPFDLHSLALATMTLLEASVIPELTSECWEYIKRVEEILDRRASKSAEPGEFQGIFTTPLWDEKLRVFIDWRRSKSQESQLQDPALSKGNASGSSAPPIVGPSEQRSLQHLADLAVGAEGSVTAAAGGGPSTPPPADNMAMDTSDLNATTSPHISSVMPHILGRVVVDFTVLTHEGYLNVFAGLVYRRR
ncbi:hypothetical protein ASPZODRAFT_134114 [Penicilliopsis zonata CBS 506.65]|uniref:Zn(2)-C6 fungal-type domain-containing protein n=1 Tax=Penicilliopsis zonata CBS 506.65 TaxID=1073090 RepID=A0A1L9SE49_9EURO|nr:hypothetical protein ASPZODRAFT_134114 [Penicilliopsis zonata CBS 506.65]OJJ45461.1 hypothetical protein ASPZODRAFT_134114 [Penicilliopsis zonata CBS 506.65]